MQDSMRSVLAHHIERYPLMEVQDAIKLLFQSEFGCEHMLTDCASAYSFLANEYGSLRQNNAPLLEDIGNGFSRLNIRAMDSYGVSVKTAFEWFASTAALKCGSTEHYDLLLQLLVDPSVGLPFDVDDVEDCVLHYKRAGYPVVHHSARYRAAYAPAYRVIRTEYAAKVLQAAENNHPSAQSTSICHSAAHYME